MNECELFNLLISLDPSPGVKGRISRDREGNYLLPEWLLVECNKTCEVKIQKLNLRYKKKGIRFNKQLLIDVLLLGFKSIEDRPKCQFCGKECRFIMPLKASYKDYRFFSQLTVENFYLTCGDKACINKKISNSVKNLWIEDSYRENMSNSHKLWASKEENKEKMRNTSLNLWKNKNYREKQISSHKLWASKEENKEKMRNFTLVLWRNEDYRNKQRNSHLEWIKNNPFDARNRNINNVGREDFRGNLIKYESSWEKLFINCCNSIQEVTSLVRSDFLIEYYFDGYTRLYLPDFIITLNDGRRLIVEIKSDYLLNLESTKEKIKSAKLFVEKSLDFDEYKIFSGDQLFSDKNRKNIDISIIRQNLLN